MARPWYAFYPADYGRDTGHLSLIEHGAYRALMDHYYATAAPLPADLAQLLRLCRANAPAEAEAVRFVLEEFFDAAADGWHHRRIDAEIAKAEEISARCSLAARIGNAKRSLQPRGADADAPADNGAERPPSQSHAQAHRKYESGTPGFEEFWAAYPKREAKAPARRAYARALGGAAPEILIAAARAYGARREGQDAAFTKLPATWLSQECWLDDVCPSPATGAHRRRRRRPCGRGRPRRWWPRSAWPRSRPISARRRSRPGRRRGAALLLTHDDNIDDAVRVADFLRDKKSMIEEVWHYLANLPQNVLAPRLPKENFQELFSILIAKKAQSSLEKFAAVMIEFHEQLYSPNFQNPKKKIKGAYMPTADIGFQRDRLHDVARLEIESRDNIFHLINAHHVYGLAIEVGFHFDVMAKDGGGLKEVFQDIVTRKTSSALDTHVNITPCDRLL
jgi:uncharacterized protein YdaU (DUF1376 family)